MDSFYWKILLRWEDLGVPLFQETSKNRNGTCFELSATSEQVMGKTNLDLPTLKPRKYIEASDSVTQLQKRQRNRNPFDHMLENLTNMSGF